MNLVIREPWSLIGRFNRDLDGLLGATSPTASNFVPAVDVHEEADQFVLEADLPGVSAADIEVTAEKGVLTLRGERKAEARETATGYERIERVHGNFVRRFVLPEQVQADAIKARFTSGVLTVTVPKQAQIKPQRVTVETN